MDTPLAAFDAFCSVGQLTCQIMDEDAYPSIAGFVIGRDPDRFLPKTGRRNVVSFFSGACWCIPMKLVQAIHIGNQLIGKHDNHQG